MSSQSEYGNVGNTGLSPTLLKTVVPEPEYKGNQSDYNLAVSRYNAALQAASGFNAEAGILAASLTKADLEGVDLSTLNDSALQVLRQRKLLTTQHGETVVTPEREARYVNPLHPEEVYPQRSKAEMQADAKNLSAEDFLAIRNRGQYDDVIQGRTK